MKKNEKRQINDNTENKQTKIYVHKENNKIIIITLTLLFFGKELIVLLYMLLQIF